MLDGGDDGQATSLNEGVKSEGKSEIPPCLSFWARRPESGSGDQNGTTTMDEIWTKNEQTWALTQFRLKRKSRHRNSKRPKYRISGKQMSGVGMIGGAVWGSIGTTQSDGCNTDQRYHQKGITQKGESITNVVEHKGIVEVRHLDIANVMCKLMKDQLRNNAFIK